MFEKGFDPGIVNYFYSSIPGLILIGIKLLIGWLWFLYSVIFTIKNFPEKRLFYVLFTIFFSIWFWIGPAIILISSYFIADHVRQFVGYVVQSSIITIGHLFFMILTRPNKGNKMFPYHVKTNQIGFINDSSESGTGADTNNPNSKKNEDTEGVFPHHSSDQGGNKNFNDVDLKEIFTIKRRDEKYTISEPSTFSSQNELGEHNDEQMKESEYNQP